jgi:hypothetical protein
LYGEEEGDEGDYDEDMVVLLVVLFSDDDALLFVVVTFEFELF